MGECQQVSGEAGECRPNTNTERSFEKQVDRSPKKQMLLKKQKMLNLMTATTRPPVSEFIREITRATEEDRKRRYPSLSKSIKYYPILSNTTQHYPWL